MTGGSGFSRGGGGAVRAALAALARRYDPPRAPLALASTPLLPKNINQSRRQPFFSVPNFEAMCAKSFSSRKTVQHSPSNLFAVVVDVDRYEEFVPFCARSSVVRRHDSQNFEAELEIGFRLFNEKYLSNVTLVPGESVTAEAVTGEAAKAAGRGGGSGLFERLVSTWKFSPGAHANECVVDFDIDFRVGSVIHAQAVGLFFEEVSRMQINAFEERCDRLYGRHDNGRAAAAGAVAAEVAAAVPAPAKAATDVVDDAWERRVLTAFEEAEVKSALPGGGAAEDESSSSSSSSSSSGGGSSDGGGGGDGGSGSSSSGGVSGQGLGLRDFSTACAALDGVEPFAAVSSRPLLCGALHVALDVGGGGRVTAEQALAAATLLRRKGSLESSQSSGSGYVIREVDAAELKAYLLDQLRALKRRMPNVARLASQQQQQQRTGTGGSVSSSSLSSSSDTTSSSSTGAAREEDGDGSGGGGGGDGGGGGGGGGGDSDSDGGFEILLETAMADVMVEQALEGADQLAGVGAVQAESSWTHSSKTPGCNPRAYEVKNRFPKFAFHKFQLVPPTPWSCSRRWTWTAAGRSPAGSGRRRRGGTRACSRRTPWTASCAWGCSPGRRAAAGAGVRECVRPIF
jgi:coenzyme Q-binding protein COQ10